MTEDCDEEDHNFHTKSLILFIFSLSVISRVRPTTLKLDCINNFDVFILVIHFFLFLNDKNFFMLLSNQFTLKSVAYQIFFQIS